jgi:hypothetical protein
MTLKQCAKRNIWIKISPSIDQGERSMPLEICYVGDVSVWECRGWGYGLSRGGLYGVLRTTIVRTRRCVEVLFVWM